MRQDILSYIEANWESSIYRDAPGAGFGGVDLPFPYTSPCIKGKGKFYYFFYWDTYFTNAGLLRSGRAAIAKANIQNMLWLIKRQGYMPNYIGLYNRSQAPYLCRMVKEYIAATGDCDFLAECADGLRQEYHFWTTARFTPVGLNRYGHHDTAEGCEGFYNQYLIDRLKFSPAASSEEKVHVGGHYMAEAESGCDFTPRFEGRCLDYCPVELNALLYEYEVYLLDVSESLGWGDAALWKNRAAQRHERMNRYLWNEKSGLFLDYDFVNGKSSPAPSLAGFNALAAGLASEEQAARMVANLPLFEREHGISCAAEPEQRRGFQWDYPNVWPPLVYITVEGLRRYGYEKEARRIAGKYIQTAILLFEKTGQLWEKTDAETGEVAGGEYEAAPMMGWSAGVFLTLHEYVQSTCD
ncbi:MAG: alpha,alpha-trehalase [Kiritimatiellaceae bacterium]|nr:alpha,alpha-trehalase [Kiritimatiellaceae bacterium]